MKSLEELEKEYRRRTPTSLKCFERAVKSVQGGASSNFQIFEPYPVFWDHASGSKTWDVDGNEYIDLNMAFGVMLVGYSHPLVVKAATERLPKGTVFCAPTDLTAACAEEIKKRFPVDLVRFTNSGTESTMHALRAARAYNGRDKIIKIEGCYHGMHDYLLQSVAPPLDKIGPDDRAITVPSSTGIPKDVSKDIIAVPFNNIDAMKTALESNKGKVSAVIVEPVMLNRGVITPRDGYLDKLRKLTEEHKVVLIFDEVKTGCKIAAGGASEYYNIKPDLITLAKAIGGGFSLGAFGGKKEIMENIKYGEAAHGGTYSANPLAAQVGITVMRDILTKESLAHAIKMEEKLVDGMGKIMKANGIPHFINSIGPCGMIFFTEHDIYDYRTFVKYCNEERFTRFFFSLANNGIWMSCWPDEHWTISIQHTEEDIDKILAVIEKIAPDI
jgi:glutamate-1-semialdehyde 2,1-aminomutase